MFTWSFLNQPRLFTRSGGLESKAESFFRDALYFRVRQNLASGTLDKTKLNEKSDKNGVASLLNLNIVRHSACACSETNAFSIDAGTLWKRGENRVAQSLRCFCCFPTSCSDYVLSGYLAYTMNWISEPIGKPTLFSQGSPFYFHRSKSPSWEPLWMKQRWIVMRMRMATSVNCLAKLISSKPGADEWGGIMHWVVWRFFSSLPAEKRLMSLVTDDHALTQRIGRTNFMFSFSSLERNTFWLVHLTFWYGPRTMHSPRVVSAFGSAVRPKIKYWLGLSCITAEFEYYFSCPMTISFLTFFQLSEAMHHVHVLACMYYTCIMWSPYQWLIDVKVRDVTWSEFVS